MVRKPSYQNQVAIIQQIIPEYREDFFLALSRLIDVELYTSYKGLEKSIYTHKNKSEYHKYFCPNINFFNKFIFQFLPFVKLTKKKEVIFEFNIRILSNIFLLILRIIFKKNNILWTHGISKNMSSTSIILRLFFIRRATSIIVYEDTAKNELKRLGINKDKIFVAKNSLNISKISKLVDSSVVKFRITYIGRVVDEKNISLLCEAFSSIQDSIPSDIVLTIIGNGSQLNQLKAIYSSNRIDFVGELIDENSIAFYMNQSLFLVSPDYVGLMIIHGFSYSIPILMNENPKIPHSPEIELFEEGTNGFYFDGRQVHLELMLVKCLEDNELLKKFGANGHNIVKNQYGIDVMVNSFLEALAYNNIASTK